MQTTSKKLIVKFVSLKCAGMTSSEIEESHLVWGSQKYVERNKAVVSLKKNIIWSNSHTLEAKKETLQQKKKKEILSLTVLKSKLRFQQVKRSH